MSNRKKSLWKDWHPASEQEVEELAVGLFKGSGQWRFVASETAILQCLPLALGALSNNTKNSVSKIGAVLGNANSIGPRAINGLPIYSEIRLIHQDDWVRVVEKWRLLESASKNALEEARVD